MSGNCLPQELNPKIPKEYPRPDDILRLIRRRLRRRGRGRWRR